MAARFTRVPPIFTGIVFSPGEASRNASQRTQISRQELQPETSKLAVRQLKKTVLCAYFIISHFIFIEMPLYHRGNLSLFWACSLLFCWTASSYWDNLLYLFPFVEGIFIACFFSLKELSLSVHWSSSDQLNPVLQSHTGLFLGSSFSFLNSCLGTSFSTLFTSLTSLCPRQWSH